MTRITIKKTVSDFSEQRQSYDMLLEITEASGLAPEIFVFKRMLPAVGNTTGSGMQDAKDEFISIADPVDMEDFPVDLPGSPDNPYFRKSTVLLRFRSILDLSETWDYIIADIRGLTDAIDTGVTGGTAETVVIQ